MDNTGKKLAGALICITASALITVTASAEQVQGMTARKPDEDPGFDITQPAGKERDEPELSKYLGTVAESKGYGTKRESQETDREEEEPFIFIVIDAGENARSYMLCRIDDAHSQIKIASILGGSEMGYAGEAGGKTICRLDDIFTNSGMESAAKAIESSLGVMTYKRAHILIEDIDALLKLTDGIWLNLSGDEAYALGFEKAGSYFLDSTKAQAYARLSLENDSGRTDRRREVLSAVFTKAGRTGSVEEALLLYWMAARLKISGIDIYDLASLAGALGTYRIEEAVFPDYGSEPDIHISLENGKWTWEYDTLSAGSRLEQFLAAEQETDTAEGIEPDSILK